MQVLVPLGGEEMKRELGKATDSLETWCDPQDYQRMMRRLFSWVSRSWARSVFNLATQGNDKAPKILDVGCGPGQATVLLAREFAKRGLKPKIIGVDISKEATSLARENAARSGLNNMEFKLGDARSLPFGENEFHFVTAAFLAPFLDKAELSTFLEETHRVLKPGGKFYFLCTNRNILNLMGAYLLTGKLREYEVSAVRYSYTPEETSKIISESPLSNGSRVKRRWGGIMVETFGTINKPSSR